MDVLMRISAFFLFILLGVFSYAADNTLYFPPGELTPLGGHSVEFRGNYFSSIAQYNQDGVEETLADTSSFTMLDYELHYAYGYSPTLEFYMMGRYRQVTAEDSAGLYEASGIESGYAGARYFLGKWKNFKFTLKGHIGNTMHSNEEVTRVTDEMVLGDSGMFYLFGGQVSRAISGHHFIAGGFFYSKPPGEYQSPQYEYFAETALRYQKWAFALGVRGHQSLEADTYTGDEDNKPDINTHVTASFNSINSSGMNGYGSIRYKFGRKYSLGLEYQTTLSGVSVDKGTRYSGMIHWALGGLTGERSKLQSFKEYEIEAVITKVSPRGKFVKIDKGLASDVSKGMVFDIYKTDVFGGNTLVAKGVIKEVSASWAVIKILKKYNSLRVQKGFVARGN